MPPLLESGLEVAMKRQIQLFNSFEEAEAADYAFYASLSPQQRLDMVLELVARYREANGEAAEGFKRVYRVVEFS